MWYVLAHCSTADQKVSTTMMTKVRTSWQRFLDGATRTAPRVHAPAAPSRAPRSRVGARAPYTALAPVSRPPLRAAVPAMPVARRLTVQERDAARAEYERPLSLQSRMMLDEMDQVAGELYALRQAARRVAALPRAVYAFRHKQNMAQYAGATPVRAAHGTLFIDGLTCEPGTDRSLGETLPHAWNIVGRALFAAEFFQAAPA
jgi:hypothetical protein